MSDPVLLALDAAAQSGESLPCGCSCSRPEGLECQSCEHWQLLVSTALKSPLRAQP
jgi:hypothetical protein